MSATYRWTILDARTRQNIVEMEGRCACQEIGGNRGRWFICDYHEGFDAALEIHTGNIIVGKRSTASPMRKRHITIDETEKPKKRKKKRKETSTHTVRKPIDLGLKDESVLADEHTSTDEQLT